MLRRFSLRKRRPSIKTFRVIILDGTNITLNLDTRSSGKELLDRVLQETGVSSDKVYFGLAVQEADYLKWILLQKTLKKQLPGRSPYTVLFRVHIYPHNHHSMMQSLTRHYLYLQIKQDLQMSRLQPSSTSITNRIAALVVQGEIGNYIPHICTNGYIRELRILPNMTSGVEESIRQAHRLNRGRLPGDCEEEVLDLVQDEPTYGSYYYNVQDAYRQPVALCVCPAGIRVTQGGRQIACFKWEIIVKVYHRGKHIHFNMDTSQALSVYEAHYVCRNTVMSQNISTWCQTLLAFYCSTSLVGDSKSRLKRFFSSRRSLRRRPNQIQAQFGGNSNPLLKRNRRASVGGETGRSVASDNSFENSGRTSFMKRPPKRTDSKLVIYGLSGLASPPEQASPSRNSTHSVISPTLCESPFSSPDNRMGHGDSMLENAEKDGLGRVSKNSSISLQVIQEDSGSGFGMDSSEHRTRSKMDGIGNVESGIDLCDVHVNSERFSASGLSSPLDFQTEHTGRNRYGPERGSELELDTDHWNSTTHEETDLEHKTIATILQQQQQPFSRFMPSRDPRESPNPPPLPPRTFDEMDVSMVDDEEYHFGRIGSPTRVRENLPLPPLPSPSGKSFREQPLAAMDHRKAHQSTPQLHHAHFKQSPTHQEPRTYYLSSHPQSNHSPHSQSHPHPHPRPHSHHSHQQHHHHHARQSFPTSQPGSSPRHHHDHSPSRKQTTSASSSQHRQHNQQFSLSQPSTLPQSHTHNSSHSHHHHNSPAYPQPSQPSSSPRQHSSPSSYRSTRGGGSERDSQRSQRHRRDSNSTSCTGSGSPVVSSHDQSYDADQSQDGTTSSVIYRSGRRSAQSNSTLEPRSDLRYSYRAAGQRYSFDEDSMLEDAVVSPGNNDHHRNGRSPSSNGMESNKQSKYSHSSTQHYQAARKGQPPRTNGAWQEEEEFVPPTTKSLPLHSHPNYSLCEEDEECEEVQRKNYQRSSSSGRPRAGSLHDTASLHEGGWHVPRHKRLRHSTITSLTSLTHSDVTGGLYSRLGSIASLDHQANLAELSQTDSIGYFDPHVRSLIFEASQNSQGTEL